MAANPANHNRARFPRPGKGLSISKQTALIIAILVGIFAVATPVVVSVKVAERQSVDEEKSRALTLAHDVLRRSEETGTQFGEALAKLNAAHDPNPCSDANIEIMQQIDVESSYLQTIGYAAHDRLMCTASGRLGAGVPIGPPDFLSSLGLEFRRGVSLPFAPGMKFLICTEKKSGYSVVIHPGLVTDIQLDGVDVSIGLFNRSLGHLILSKGVFDQSWAHILGKGSETSFYDGQHVVAICRSKSLDLAAFASLPDSRVQARVTSFAQVMVPVGVFVGILLALAVGLLGRQQLSLPAIIKSALRRQEFYAVYQPIVDLRTGKWCGAEALIRWQRPRGESVSPTIFIPAAEKSQLITKVTDRMMEIVLGESARCCRENPDFYISVNFSPADLRDPGIVDRLNEMIKASGLEGRNFVVEATERGFMDPNVARNVVRAMRGLGVRVAIDDFGTGYSSLSYLNTLELDLLKIDKSFVDTIGTDSVASDVIVHIVAMAKSLGLELVAEGVETEEQVQFLRDLGVQYAQGWRFAKPMSMVELIQGMGSADGDAQPGEVEPGHLSE